MYAVALQIEDFVDENSSYAMSSVNIILDLTLKLWYLKGFNLIFEQNNSSCRLYFIYFIFSKYYDLTLTNS